MRNRSAIAAALAGVALAAAACGRYGPPQRAPLATTPTPSQAVAPPPAAAAPGAQAPAAPQEPNDDDDDSE